MYLPLTYHKTYNMKYPEKEYQEENTGRWSRKEAELFKEGLLKYGKS